MSYLIRPARLEDAANISRVILSALRETNAKDYSEAVIARVEQSFSPASVAELLTRRLVFIAVDEATVIGTANLDNRVVRTVFINPTYQKRGIGRELMAEVLQAAVAVSVDVLAVPSSVTAEPFYSNLGFKSVRNDYHGEERTIWMERPL